MFVCEAVSVIENERKREVKMVDALPQRTIGAMASMALKVSQACVQAFFGQVREGCEKGGGGGGGWREGVGELLLILWEGGWMGV